MDIEEAVVLMDALSQETRMRVFRLLVQAGPEGMPAGQLSETLATPQNTMSFHLNHMANAGLISPTRQGRSILYSANFAQMHNLIRFLVHDCCSAQFARLRQDKKKDCSVIELAACCSPANKWREQR